MSIFKTFLMSKTLNNKEKEQVKKLERIPTLQPAGTHED